MVYQLIVIGPDAAKRQGALVNAFDLAVVDMGLTPSVDCSVLGTSNGSLGTIDFTMAPVAIWCGKESASVDPAELQILTRLLSEGHPVFPVVPSVKRYKESVPTELLPINGQEWADLAAVVSNIMQAFRLLPRYRRVFISYRRDESRSVAIQLFHALQERRYDAFLDTASIEAGAKFQAELHDQLVDVDLVILLHTASALNSEWVYEEIINAQRRGTEVLEMRWPNVKPARDMAFSRAFPLQDPDDLNWNANREAGRLEEDDELSADCIERVVPAIEQARLRSVANRRYRIVRQLLEDAADASLAAAFLPAGDNSISLPLPHVTVYRGDGQAVVGRLLPCDRTPRSTDLQAGFDSLSHLSDGPGSARLIFDDIGVQEETIRHLRWLNSLLPMQSLSTRDAATWLGGR